MATPLTSFPELDDLLEQLAAGAADALGDDLVGVYVLGSFALGAGTEQSDVDFLVVTAGPVATAAEQALRELHRRLPHRGSYWAQHLEGSYAPADDLRSLPQEPAAWLYVDNGSREMELSTHCNTAIVRRTLYRHGVVVTGPPPKHVVLPVTNADLSAESWRLAEKYLEWVESAPHEIDNRWSQPYVVTTFCRMLATITTGEVFSKPAALEWAVHNLDVEWRPLVEQAAAESPVPFSMLAVPARRGSVEPTRRFVDYAVRQAAGLVGEPGFEPGTGRI